MSLKHAILVLLETEPGSGYDLLKQFKGGLGYFWNAKHQQIYQELKKLLNSDLISCSTEHQTNKPDRKVYEITPQGIEELKLWLSDTVKPSKVNDALLVKLYAGHLVDDLEIICEIEKHRDMHIKTLKKLLEIEKTYHLLPPNKQTSFKYPYFTLRRGILGEQAWLEWANETIESIKK